MRQKLAWALVVVAVAMAAACGSDPAGTAPVDTAAAETTDSATTSIAIVTTVEPATTTGQTTATSTSTTTSTVAHAGFDPPCTEQAPTRPTLISDDVALDRLGPIGVEPAIRIELPSGYSIFDNSLQPASSMTTRIPSGMLVAVVSSYFPGTMLVAVDHDGHVRWRRCLDERAQVVASAPANEGPDEALVVTSTFVDDGFETTWWSISLDDGTPTPTLADSLDRLDLPGRGAPLATVQSYGGPAVLGPDGTHVVDIDVDRLAVIDLTDMSVAAIPFPPEFDGHPASELQLESGVDGELLRMGLDAMLVRRVPKSVWTGEIWSTDAALLRAARPLTAGYGYQPSVDGSMPMLEATDALGEIRWRRDDLRLMIGEGFHAGVVDDRVVAISCRPITGDDVCREYRTGAYSLATGATLWEVTGFRTVTASGNGLAMMSTREGDETTSGWALVDLAMGEPIRADQVWPEPSAFLTECCGGDEYQRVDQHGGVLTVQTGGALLVYLPEDASHPTVDIDVNVT